MNRHTLTNSILRQGTFSPGLPRVHWKALWIFTFFIVVSLLFFYIFQVNEMTKASLLIPVYEKQIAELSQENKTLKIYFSKANSLKNISSLAKELNFEPIGRIHYIKILEGAVVTK